MIDSPTTFTDTAGNEGALPTPVDTGKYADLEQVAPVTGVPQMARDIQFEAAGDEVAVEGRYALMRDGSIQSREYNTQGQVMRKNTVGAYNDETQTLELVNFAQTKHLPGITKMLTKNSRQVSHLVDMELGADEIKPGEPPMPKTNPGAGDKTGPVEGWYYQWRPKEFRLRYKLLVDPTEGNLTPRDRMHVRQSQEDGKMEKVHLGTKLSWLAERETEFRDPFNPNRILGTHVSKRGEVTENEDWNAPIL